MLNKKEKSIIKILKNGGVGVISTDTIYGLVGSAFSKKAVARIYKIKKRNKNKPLIILISTISDLKKFGININPVQHRALNKFWPGKVSIVLSGIAFRLPAKKSLIQILKKTGPLVAPSANPESFKPAENITQAKKYFSPVRGREGSQRAFTSNGIDSTVDFYLSGGTIKSKPSALIKIGKRGEIEILRGTI